MQKPPRIDLSDVSITTGVLLMAYGIWQFSPPIMCILLGLFLFGLGARKI